MVYFEWRVIHNAIIVTIFCFTTNLKDCSGLNIEKVSPDPIFVNVGQPLRLQINLHQLQSDKWYINGVWVFFSADRTSDRVGKDLVLLRRIDRHDAYNHTWDPRATAERLADLFLINTTLNDTGTYMFMFRIPPSLRWNTTVIFSVTIEEKPRAEMTCPNTVHLKEGEQFSCLCKAIALGRLVPNVSWIKNGKMIRGNSNSSQKLSFDLFNQSMAGAYVCRANIGTLIDETMVYILKKVPQQVRKCAEGWEATHIISISGPIGVAGIFLGVIITLGVQWVLEKTRNGVPDYVEPQEVKPEYQELDVRRIIESENSYQPLQLDAIKELKI